MTMRKILWTSVMGLSLMLGACGQGDAGKDGKTAAKDAKKVDAKGKGDVKANDAKAGDAKAGDAKAGDVKDDGGAEPAADVFDERVVKAAGLAKKIEAEPARADEILAEAGLDRTAFDALIYEVSTPELAEQYRLARARDAG
jgi:hypothetical protein